MSKGFWNTASETSKNWVDKTLFHSVSSNQSKSDQQSQSRQRTSLQTTINKLNVYWTISSEGNSNNWLQCSETKATESVIIFALEQCFFLWFKWKDRHLLTRKCLRYCVHHLLVDVWISRPGRGGEYCELFWLISKIGLYLYSYRNRTVKVIRRSVVFRWP